MRSFWISSLADPLLRKRLEKTIHRESPPYAVLLLPPLRFILRRSVQIAEGLEAEHGVERVLRAARLRAMNYYCLVPHADRGLTLYAASPCSLSLCLSRDRSRKAQIAKNNIAPGWGEGENNRIGGDASGVAATTHGGGGVGTDRFAQKGRCVRLPSFLVPIVPGTVYFPRRAARADYIIIRNRDFNLNTSFCSRSLSRDYGKESNPDLSRILCAERFLFSL